jgi:hypothetical protein
MSQLSRRDVLKIAGATGAAGAATLLGGAAAGHAATARPARAAAPQATFTPPPGIGSRGYYITFCRIPTAGYDTWRSIFDTFADDGIQHVIMWMGGAFRSRKYPITWQYNRDHENVRHDFVGRLIDHAHSRGVKILLGFSPYTYDGTNQYAFERPDLKGIQANGKLARLQGIDSWGYNLDPTKPDTQAFMLDYARELCFDFYPNADGLLIESADIDICVGGDCGGPSHYYEVEYQFVKQISDDVWAHNPDAQILVHPNYFIGGSNGANEPYDPRWGLMFSPWTVNFDLIKRVSYAYYFDLDVISQPPANMQASARYVRDHGFAGYLPSQEFFTYVPEHAEIGEPGVIGRQLHPFGIDVIGLDTNPYVDPIASVNRIAYREYMRDPDLPEAGFRAALGQSVFGDTATDQNIDDLLFLHDCFYRNKSLFSPSAQADPHVLRDNLEQGLLSFDDLRKIQTGLDALPAVAHRVATSRNPRVRALTEHTALMRRNWDPGSRQLLAAHLR